MWNINHKLKCWQWCFLIYYYLGAISTDWERGIFPVGGGIPRMGFQAEGSILRNARTHLDVAPSNLLEVQGQP